MNQKNTSPLGRFCLLVFLCGTGFVATGQNLQLVWADEFEETSINPTTWQFENGPSNDNLQFYTDRTDNAKVVDGKLRISALKESYQGYAYTSAHIRTELAQGWKYGRMEASIKLPGTPGFVPAFWMLPVDNLYGWWPYSGEIDIMEHPTNEVTKIYGTVHTETYNLFAGPLPPQGSTFDVPDAEITFHLYAIEWTSEKIDFFVDDQKYYSFENDHGSSASWPFDQPFYIILNLAVGGGWVGTPDESSVFPAIMEVEYVRIYQDLNDMEIQGPDFITYNSPDVTYSLGEIEGAAYQWNVPGGAEITSGQGSPQITMRWGLFGGNVEAVVNNGQDQYVKTLPVRVSHNLLKNMGFEKGVKYWQSAAGYPAKADIMLDGEIFSGGAHSIFAGVTDPGGNTWDVQLSQSGFVVQSGTKYHVQFMAKSGATQEQISAAVINVSDFTLAGQKTISPEKTWGLHEFDFTPSGTFSAAFNVDMGGHIGNYNLDDFVLTTADLTDLNLVKNPDFFDGEEAWALTSHSAAIVEGTVVEDEYALSIGDGGTNSSDVHFGQSGLPVENGYEYMVSFDGYADAPRQISPLVGQNREPWTVYSDAAPVSLTTTRQTYSFTFSMTEPTDLQSRLGFDIGGDDANVYFDNIQLRKSEAINTSSIFSGTSFQSMPALSIYPNPFQNVTSFHYTLREPAQVSIRIFNLNGQEVSTIEHGFRLKGDHIAQWAVGDLSAGIYFCQLLSGEKSEIRRLVLLQ